MIAYPRFPERPYTLLDGVWDFTFLGEEIDLEIVDPSGIRFDDKFSVPGCFDASPAYAGGRGTAAYRTPIEIEPGNTGLLKFHGLGIWCRIYVDGEVLFEGAYPYSGFTVEVPPSDNRRRELVVLIDNRFDFDRAPLQEQYFDFYAYGGIFRSVELYEVPKEYIRRVEVLPQDPATGRIMLRVDTAIQTDTAEVAYDGGVFGPVKLKAEGDRLTAEVAVPSPRIWSPEDPQLHTLTLRLGEDQIEERFGLRSVKAEAGKVLINGKATKLLGFCRHEAHPQFGPALPLQQLVQDLQLLKELGCNFIRGSHYPQDQRFLDLCDELGFLVFEESLSWQAGEKQMASLEFKRQQLEQTRMMAKNSINHPSVIIWGFLNEGESHKEYSRELYTGLIDLLRAEDPSRLITYASNHPFEDLFLEQVDLISVNKYPGWYAEDNEQVGPLNEIAPLLDALVEDFGKRGLEEKPLIISEMGAGAIYGWRDPLKAHWSEEYQADHLESVAREIVEREEYAGVSLWQFCDCRTYASAYAIKRPRGFNNKGIVDEYRRPKLAYERVKAGFRD